MIEWIEVIRRTGILNEVEPLAPAAVPTMTEPKKVRVRIRIVDGAVEEFNVAVRPRRLGLHIEFFYFDYEGIAAWVALLEQGCSGVHLELDDVSISDWTARGVPGTDLLHLRLDWEREPVIDAIVSRQQLVQAFRDEMRRFFASLTEADLVDGEAEEEQIEERRERWAAMRNNPWLFPEGPPPWART